MQELPPAGGLLTLDLAPGVTGWAYAPLDHKAPAFGTFKMPKLGGEGAIYAAFINALYETLDLCEPSAIAAEAPLPPQAQTDTRTAFKQYAMRGFVYEAAYRKKIPVSEQSADLVRYDLLGRTRWPKGQTKVFIVQHVRKLNIDVHDHNAADAIMVWLWHQRQLMRARPPTGRMWGVVA